jgi:hypothetical protein
LCGVETFRAKRWVDLALDYPSYEIIFCLAARPVAPPVRGAIAAFPWPAPVDRR